MSNAILVPRRHPDPNIDAHRLMPHLWQGSYPHAGAALKPGGFDVLVLCAYELQHPEDFPDVEVVLCPLDDARLSTAEASAAHEASRRLADLWHQGKRILVTCAQGRNRSGLVSALTMRLLAQSSGKDAARHVRMMRPNSLTNPSFNEYLDRLAAPSAKHDPKRHGAAVMRGRVTLA